MTVAVRTPETTSAGLLSRLPVAILLGVVYLLGSLAALIGIWWVWWKPEYLGFNAGVMANYVLLYLVEIAAGVGLFLLGRKLVGPAPPKGLRAGIFTAFAVLLIVAVLATRIGLWIENYVYDSQALPETMGTLLAAGVGVLLLFAAARFFFLREGADRRLVAFEEQGWFGTGSYKRNQGQRVRRATIVGLLCIVGYGVWTMESHNTLRGSRHWALDVPFTGGMYVASAGDADDVGLLPKDVEGTVVDRRTFREATEKLTHKDDGYARITDPGTSGWEKGDLKKKTDFTAKEKELKENREQVPPKAGPVEAPKGSLRHTNVLVLPDVRYTLPLILAALGLWLSWRTVNMPAFADFLIATEAELNKVSWTTRKRLIQDTIVVLATVVLMTVFLFVVDIAWGKLLAAIDVLRLPPPAEQKSIEKQPW